MTLIGETLCTNCSRVLHSSSFIGVPFLICILCPNLRPLYPISSPSGHNKQQHASRIRDGDRHAVSPVGKLMPA